MAKFSESNSFTELKKNIGALIIQTNNNILELQEGLKRIQSGGAFNKLEKEKEAALLSQKTSLEEAAAILSKNEQSKSDVQMEKYIKLIETTITTAEIIFNNDGSLQVNEDRVKDIQRKAEEILSADQVNPGGYIFPTN